MREDLHRIRRLAGLNESMTLTNLKLEAPRFKMWSDDPIPFSATLENDGQIVGNATIMVSANAHPDAYRPDMVDIENIDISVNGNKVDPASIDIPFDKIKMDLLDVIGDPYEWPKPDLDPPGSPYHDDDYFQN